MAQSAVVQIVSDQSGKTLTEDEARQVTLSFQGRTVELDLSVEEVEKLSKTLNPFLEAGRPLKARKPAKGRPDTSSGLSKEDLRNCREWWTQTGEVEGFEPKTRGRIPSAVLNKWVESGKPSY